VASDERAVSVKAENEEFLSREVSHLKGEIVVNVIRASQFNTAGAIASGTGAKFEGGLELAGFGKAEAMFLAEFFEVETS